MNNEPLPVGQPASLRPRGPRRIELSDAQGQRIAIRRKGVLLYSGQRLRIRVFVVAGQSATRTITIQTDDSLAVVQAPSTYPERSSEITQAEYRAVLKSSLPEAIAKWHFFMPTTGELVISIADGEAAPITITIAVRVRPRFRGILGGITLAIVAAYLSPIAVNAATQGGFWGLLAALGRPDIWLNTLLYAAIGSAFTALLLAIAVAWE